MERIRLYFCQEKGKGALQLAQKWGQVTQWMTVSNIYSTKIINRLSK